MFLGDICGSVEYDLDRWAWEDPKFGRNHSDRNTAFSVNALYNKYLLFFRLVGQRVMLHFQEDRIYFRE